MRTRTPYVYQATDDQVYDRAGEPFIPYLISIRNYPYKTPETVALWQLYVGDFPDPEGIRSGSVHDVTIENIRVWYAPALPRDPDGAYQITVIVKKDRENTQYENISIQNIFANGQPFPFSVVQEAP